MGIWVHKSCDCHLERPQIHYLMEEGGGQKTPSTIDFMCAGCVRVVKTNIQKPDNNLEQWTEEVSYLVAVYFFCVISHTCIVCVVDGLVVSFYCFPCAYAFRIYAYSSNGVRVILSYDYNESVTRIHHIKVLGFRGIKKMAINSSYAYVTWCCQSWASS